MHNGIAFCFKCFEMKLLIHSRKTSTVLNHTHQIFNRIQKNIFSKWFDHSHSMISLLHLGRHKNRSMNIGNLLKNAISFEFSQNSTGFNRKHLKWLNGDWEAGGKFEWIRWNVSFTKMINTREKRRERILIMCSNWGCLYRQTHSK